MPGILVVEDDPVIRHAVTEFLRAAGYTVTAADGVVDAENAFRRSRPDAVVMDHELGDGTSLELLPRLRRVDPSVPVLVLTGHGSIDLAVQAIKEGADQFLVKPVPLPALAVLLERVLEGRRAQRHHAARPAATGAPDPFLGESDAMRRLQEHAWRAAESNRPVWLLGETGTGKGVLARWLHARSPRADEPMVELNCAALPRELVESELFGHERGSFTGAVEPRAGLVEAADRGTLMLDEIGDMPPELQPKLLTVLDENRFRRVGSTAERTVDVRLLAATHRDLRERVAGGGFRADLFFRISTLQLRVPPLRERREDLPHLAGFLLRRLAAELGRPAPELSGDALAALRAHHWPGNVRELRNVLERGVLLHPVPVLGAAHLHFDAWSAPAPPLPAADPPSLVSTAPGDGTLPTLRQVEREHIHRCLQAGGSVERAARLLDVPRSTLYGKLREHGLAPPRRR